MDVIPFPDMSSLNGVLNFAAHLSDRGPTPDLGMSLLSQSFILKLTTDILLYRTETLRRSSYAIQ